MSDVNLSKDLPLIYVNDIAVEVVGIIAQRKKGKTYTGTKLFEELYHADVQCVAIDQVGNWHYLRNSSTGRGAGLSICVFGGLNGDIPILPDAGKLMANVVVKHHLSCVIDVSQFRKGERIKFCQAFCEELFHLKKSKNTPLHLFLEEVHKIAPQKPGPDELGMLGAIEDIVRVGRNFGIGCTLLDQRPASVNKELLTQVSILMVGSIIHNLDRKAIKDWIVNHSAGTDDDTANTYLDQLPGLDKKEKYFWYPEKGIFKKIAISKKSTFDGSATPQAGEGPVSSRVKTEPFDKEEMAELLKEMGSIAEEAKANDPKFLRSEVARLKANIQALAAIPAPTPLPAPPPILTPKSLDLLDGIISRHTTRLEGIATQFGDAVARLDVLRDRAAQSQQVITSELGNLATELAQARSPLLLQPKTFFLGDQHTTHTTKSEASKGRGIVFNNTQTPRMDRCDRAIIGALVQYHPEPMTRLHICIYTGYRAGSGGFNNAMGRLTSGGFIAKVDASKYQLTSKGSALPIEDDNVLRKTTRQLLDLWKPKFQGKAKDILELIVDQVGVHGGIGREQIAKNVGMALGSGGFNNYMGALTSAGLIKKEAHNLYVAADEFYR